VSDFDEATYIEAYKSAENPLRLFVFDLNSSVRAIQAVSQFLSENLKHSDYDSLANIDVMRTMAEVCVRASARCELMLLAAAKATQEDNST
jgi:hypothetical protein